jgi:hypothetical protein
LIISGCHYNTSTAETGKQISDKVVSGIIDGKTTGSQIISWFGAPTETSRLGNDELFIYKHCTTDSTTLRLPGLENSDSKEKCSELSIVLNGNDIVKSHGFVAAQ